MASMQITAAASRAPNNSRSAARGGVTASPQPIRTRSQASTASMYTMSDVGMASSGQHGVHLPSRRRARSCCPIASCTAGMPLPIISQDSAAWAARHIR